MEKVAVEVKHVSMRFNLSSQKVDNLKEYFIKLVRKELKYNEFWALKNVSLKVNRGDRLGILGLNGAGKSTLLKIIAGVLKPTEGSITVKGKIAPLLELGAGFEPVLILDEVLAVGDAKFKKKCEAKIQSMFDKGVTVLFVSHSLPQVQKICNKAILLEHGKIIASGGIEEVSNIYAEKTK